MKGAHGRLLWIQWIDLWVPQNVEYFLTRIFKEGFAPWFYLFILLVSQSVGESVGDRFVGWLVSSMMKAQFLIC